MKDVLTALACLISVSVLGQDCEFNTINIEVVGADAEIGWNITQDNGWSVVSGELGTYPNICLEDGCYPFNMYDANGNGWNETTITISYSLTNEIIFSGTLEEGNVASLTILIGDTVECQTFSYDGNDDGCVNVDDILGLLVEYGQCLDVEDLDVEDEVFISCGDYINHEGYNYSTVLIGGECWFSENCRYLPVVSSSSASSENSPYFYVYGYEGTDAPAAMATENYDTYGVLYNWPAVMTEAICPSGWHIPSDGEFTQLTDFLGGANIAGEQMKSTSGWNNNGNGSNSSGFDGRPGGYAESGGFGGSGNNGYWWSSSASGSSSAWNRDLSSNHNVVSRVFNFRSYGFSARCVRD